MAVMLVMDLFYVYLLLSCLATTGEEMWLLLLPAKTKLYLWF